MDQPQSIPLLSRLEKAHGVMHYKKRLVGQDPLCVYPGLPMVYLASPHVTRSPSSFPLCVCMVELEMVATAYINHNQFTALLWQHSVRFQSRSEAGQLQPLIKAGPMGHGCAHGQVDQEVYSLVPRPFLLWPGNEANGQLA